MLQDLLVLVTESDWALSTIPDVDYIKPLEEYCENTKLCDFPISLPKLLWHIGNSSEAECLRICESSLPSFFLKWEVSNKDPKLSLEIGECLLLWTSTVPSSSAFLAHHKAHFDAYLDNFLNERYYSPHLTVISHLCFSSHLEVSKMTLKPLNTRANWEFKTLAYLQKREVSKMAVRVMSMCAESASGSVSFLLNPINVPSVSANSPSTFAPIPGRLCEALARHLSQLKSLFTEYSPDGPEISALSTTPQEESPLLHANALLEVICEELSLFNTLLDTQFCSIQDALIAYDFVPTLKSAIITAIELVELKRTDPTYRIGNRSDVLFTFLHFSWCDQLLLLQHCGAVLEENLVERVIASSNPTVIKPVNDRFHLHLVWTILVLTCAQKAIVCSKEEWKRIRFLQFERAFTPAKRYLLFIIRREKFFPYDVYADNDIPHRISKLLNQTLVLEHELFGDGKIVETGREEWEVGWLVDVTNENELGERLKMIREDDAKMRMDENERWKKRVERQREAGLEDAIEGWLTRRYFRTRPEIMENLRQVRKECGMNVLF
ncbi:hypothetical protein BLNAU_12568 [Blattamonas nauphoetae]|uniref:Uncharacterized protein n=1 Tax=Blattamonas nauphoetae TaxID=2049346 RepID=A0ABQ9XJ53_9EUKA|nr:hypothetical protein BLNAU_12568 [Blattamonas nauphoetae]